MAGISKATRLCDILDRVENLPPLITWWLTQAAPLWQKLPDNCPLRVAHVAVVLLSVLRIWPIFVLGRRFSGLVAIQPGHELVTDGVYRIIRHPSYLGMLILMFG